MKRYAKGLLLVISMMLLRSCSKTVIPPRWEYEKDAVRLYYKSDPQLNFFGGSSHTLSLCVYFLEHPNDFNQAVDEKGTGHTRVLSMNCPPTAGNRR